MVLWLIRCGFVCDDRYRPSSDAAVKNMEERVSNAVIVYPEDLYRASSNANVAERAYKVCADFLENSLGDRRKAVLQLRREAAAKAAEEEKLRQARAEEDRQRKIKVEAERQEREREERERRRLVEEEEQRQRRIKWDEERRRKAEAAEAKEREERRIDSTEIRVGYV